MPTTHRLNGLFAVFGLYDPRLGPAIDKLSEGIADVAATLPAELADDYIEGELAKFAALMYCLEAKRATPRSSIGYAVDACIRERVEVKLIGRRP